MGQIRVVLYKFELSSLSVWQIQCAPYFAGPKVCQFGKNDIARILELEVINPAQTEWAAAVVFVSSEDNMIWICVAKNFKGDLVGDSRQSHRWTKT